MKGFSISEAGHVVNILPPVDITGGKTAQAFSMANYKHASIIIQIGVSAAAFTKIILNLCSDAAGDNPVAIPFNLYTQETAGASHDVLSAITAVPATGYAPSATDGTLGQDSYLQLSLTNGVNSCITSAVAVLSGSRYAEAQSPTVCT